MARRYRVGEGGEEVKEFAIENPGYTFLGFWILCWAVVCVFQMLTGWKEGKK